MKLQAKATRVLAVMMARSPDVVSRSELIAEVWGGNHLVGERGLNQAIWAIRSELGDDARQPRFIRTLPREGFLWIHKAPWHRSTRHRLTLASAVAASLGVFAIISITTSANDTGEFTLPSRCEISDNNDVKAYKHKRDVIIDIHDCGKLIVRPEGSKLFGTPFVSHDGNFVAFTVREDQTCRFVTFALRNGVHSDFDTCTIRDDV
jgi:DNA-binding winged helix-turn-helix (wHTH) protein